MHTEKPCRQNVRFRYRHDELVDLRSELKEKTKLLRENENQLREAERMATNYEVRNTELREQNERLYTEIEILRKELAELRSQQGGSQDEIERLTKELSEREVQVVTLEAQLKIAAAEARDAVLQTRISTASYDAQITSRGKMSSAGQEAQAAAEAQAEMRRKFMAGMQVAGNLNASEHQRTGSQAPPPTWRQALGEPRAP